MAPKGKRTRKVSLPQTGGGREREREREGEGMRKRKKRTLSPLLFSLKTSHRHIFVRFFLSHPVSKTKFFFFPFGVFLRLPLPN